MAEDSSRFFAILRTRKKKSKWYFYEIIHNEFMLYSRNEFVSLVCTASLYSNVLARSRARRVHSFCSLSDDRSVASSKASSPHGAI
jgi:hypothetical protein